MIKNAEQLSAVLTEHGRQLRAVHDEAAACKLPRAALANIAQAIGVLEAVAGALADNSRP